LTVHAPSGFAAELIRGRATPSPEGWESLHYAEKTPTPVILIRGNTRLPVRLVTLVTIGASAPYVADRTTPGSALIIGGLTDPELASRLPQISGQRIAHE
jgi:hypothetical protein